LPIYYDLLTFLQTMVNQRLSSINLGDLDRAHLSGFVRLYHIGIRAVWSPLDDRRRDHQPVVTRRDEQAIVHKLTRPKF